MSASAVDPEVLRLRGEISAIDRSMVLLLGARARVQRRLFRRKEELGLPRRDRRQEQRVLDRVTDWAVRYGTDERLARAVVRRSLRSGLEPAPASELLPTPGEGGITVYVTSRVTSSGAPPFPAVPLVAPRGTLRQLLSV
jgi:chorismate mutase